MSGGRDEQETIWAPGTVRLEDVTGSRTELILYPEPSTDPDDPLNWSTSRKTLNYSLVCFFILWTFVQLDIGFTAWGPINAELGFTVDQMNNGAAINYGGLAIGCIFFIPFVHRYGRRPLYLFSSALQLASVVWQAKVQTIGDFMGSNLISGLGGAISETIVQITIADVFFVHQHGTMNGWYLVFTSVGAFLGPVASGYIVESQGWRWMWWWCVIFMALNLLLVIFFYEESSYIPVVNGRSATHAASHVDETPGAISAKKAQGNGDGTKSFQNDADEEQDHLRRIQSTVDMTLPRKTYLQRLALVTPCNYSIGHHFYQPFIILLTFPAITYTAITYGVVLAAFAVLTSVQAVYLLEPPYNFGAAGVGLMNIAPFIGASLGSVAGGVLNDKSIMWFSKRNRGIYEPEMRLWFAPIAAIILPGGILMFGLGLVRGLHWAVLAVGFGVYGFGFVLTSDIALTYATDCYQDIIGDALVGIVFVRNALSLVVLFTLTPWIEAVGVQNVHIIVAAVCFVILLIPVPLLVWGKKARIATTDRYKRMAARQPVHRALGHES